MKRFHETLIDVAWDYGHGAKRKHSDGPAPIYSFRHGDQLRSGPRPQRRRLPVDRRLQPRKHLRP